MISIEFSVQWLLATLMCGVLGVVAAAVVGGIFVAATFDRLDWPPVAYPFFLVAGGLLGLWLGGTLL